MGDIPKIGKLFAIFCGFFFTFVCLVVMQRNYKQRREGDKSNRKTAEIATSALLALLGAAAVIEMLWAML